MHSAVRSCGMFHLGGRPIAIGGAMLFIATIAGPAPARAQNPTMKVGGFIDAYYAWDFGRPRAIQRPYTTQAARSGEFNVNLAYLDATVTSDRVRGRLALQAGTSVAAGYAHEPALGDSTAPLLTRNIQEAYVGLRLTENVWLDGGIMFSHLGSESWISRDNATYTRSLIADISPYVESGVRLSWEPAPTVKASVALTNGWGNISENNSDKAIGARVDWELSTRITASYYNFVGNEMPDTASARTRVFNGLSIKWSSDALKLLGTIDGGRENVPGASASSWWGASVIAQLQFSDRFRFSARAETFEDPDRIVISTPTEFALRASGGSVGIDMTPAAGMVWRTEMRVLRSPDDIFIERASTLGLTKTNQLIVTSLSVTF
jgi:hypothetical protein